MTTTPENLYASKYTTNFTHLAEQKRSRLMDAVMNDTQEEEYRYYNQIGTVASTAVTVRNVATVLNAATHYRRRVGVAAKTITVALDRIDSLKMVSDPSSAYLESAVRQMNKDIDDTIITAFDAAANTGPSGGTSTVYDTNMTVVSGAAADGLTLAKLFSAKQNLDANEVDSEDRFIVVSSKQLTDLLGTTEVTNSDYNTVKTLVTGEIDTFLGFKFIRSERLADADAGGPVVRRCFYWQKQGMLFVKGKNKLGPETIINKRPDLNNLLQMQLFYQIGSTRLDEKSVGIIEALES